jgi:hypothetical protein
MRLATNHYRLQGYRRWPVRLVSASAFEHLTFERFVECHQIVRLPLQDPFPNLVDGKDDDAVVSDAGSLKVLVLKLDPFTPDIASAHFTEIRPPVFGVREDVLLWVQPGATWVSPRVDGAGFFATRRRWTQYTPAEDNSLTARPTVPSVRAYSSSLFVRLLALLVPFFHSGLVTPGEGVSPCTGLVEIFSFRIP